MMDSNAIPPKLSDEEFFARLDALKSPKSLAREREISKKYAGMSASEMLRAWGKSPEGQKYLKEKYASD